MTQMFDKVYSDVRRKIDRMADVCYEIEQGHGITSDPELRIELHQIKEDLAGYEYFCKKHEELADEIGYIKARYPNAFRE